MQPSNASIRVIGAANDIQAIAPTAGEIGHADHWFQVSPFGRFPHRVGIQVFDREAAVRIITLFNSTKDKLARLWRGLPIFIGHPDFDPKTYPDHRKYGSIQRLEVRPDGLYAQAKWSRAGREIVNDEHFDFPSPLWNMEPIPTEAGAFRPVELISVGLTNRPNITAKPVGANAHLTTNSDDLDPMQRAALITQLRLTPLEGEGAVTDDQLAQAIAALQRAGNERAALAAQLTAETLRAGNERQARIADKLTAAANSGRMAEADRATWQLRFETDFPAAEAALQALVPAMNTRTTMQTAHLGLRNGGEMALTRAARITAANSAVDLHMKETGSDYSTAFAWVRLHKPDLFKHMQDPAS